MYQNDRLEKKSYFFQEKQLLNSKLLQIIKNNRCITVKLFFVIAIFQITFPIFSADTYIKQAGEKYELGNKYLRVLVNVESGGRIEKFVNLQTGKDLTALESSTVAPQGSGLCGERFFSKSSGSDRGFEKNPYKVSSFKTKSGLVELSLAAVRNGIKIQKTFTLTKSKASLDVKYCITNLRNKNISGRLWGTNTIYTGKGTKIFKIYYPYGGYGHSFLDHKGVKQNTLLEYHPGSNSKYNNNVVNAPSFGWMGGVDEKGNGAVIEIDFSNLDRFYSFLPSSNGYKTPTIEWFSRRFELKPIKKGIKEAAARPELTDPLKDYIYKTSCRIMPLTGFYGIAACDNGIAASVETKGGNAIVNLCADRKLSGLSLEFQVEGANKKLYAPVKIPNLNFMPGKTVKIKFTASGLNTANKLLIVKLKNNTGGQVASMFIPRFSKKLVDSFIVPVAGKKNHSFDLMIDSGKLGANFEGDSINWGGNLNRRLKILAIYPKRNHREMAELCRRFNIDLSVVEVNRPHVFGFSRSPFVSWQIPEPAELLKKKLTKKFDVVLIGGGLMWDKIPEELRKELLRKIKNGMGLVFINPAKSRSLTQLVSTSTNNYMERGIPVKYIPGLNKFASLQDVVETGFIGKGKVVLLKYNTIPFGRIYRTGPRGIVANIENDKKSRIPYWEYYFSLAGRAMRYVSGDEPQIQIVSASLKKVVIENSGLAANAELKINVFNKEWQKVDSIEKKISLSKGKSNIAFAISSNKLTMSGKYYINIFLRKADKICDWYSFAKILNKKSGIDKLLLSKTVFSKISKITGSCLLKSKAKGNLRLSIKDIYGRVIAQKTYPVNNQKISFSIIPDVAPLSILCNIRAELLSQGKSLDVAEKNLTFNIQRYRDVKFIVWGSGEANHWTKRLEMKQLRRIGFDWCTGFHVSACHENEAEAVALNVLKSGMKYMPLQIHRLAVRHSNLKEKIRKPCLRDPLYLEKIKSDVSKYANWSKKFFPPYYFVADENSLGFYNQAHDFCFGPHCMEKFRIVLKEQYSTLGELNRAWQSNFKSWADIVPSTLGEAKKSGKWASWMDHRRFMFKALGEAIAVQRKVLERCDPFAGLAVSGMGEPLLHNGFDWYEMEKNLDLAVAYLRESGRVMDPMRSFLKPGGILSAWNGSGSSYETMNLHYWHEVINSFYAPAFWHIAYLVNHGDSSISDCGKGMRKIIQSIRASGIGKLLLEAKRVPSEVGILYSTSSLIATGISGADGFVNTIVYNANLDGWSGLLRDCGFQPPCYLSRKQLLAGGLKKTSIKVFILPLTQSLGCEEIKALEDFVKNGGILLADAIPGVYKLNGNPQKVNPLFKVFGCEYKNKGIGRVNKNISFSNNNNLPLTAASKYIRTSGCKKLGTTKSKSKIVVFGGLKLGSKNRGREIPAFFINTYGKGTAIYLNALLSEYEGFRGRSNQSKAVVKAISDILSRTGLKMPGVVLPVGSELIRSSLGNTRVFAMTRILRAKPDDMQFKIKLDKSGYIYDVRQKKLLGRSDQISGTIKPGEAKVFAVLPKPIEKISLTVDKTDKGISFSVSLLNADSIIRTQLMASDGKQYAHYARNWLVKKGVINGDIALGINERHGSWKLIVRDTISGGEITKNIDFN